MFYQVLYLAVSAVIGLAIGVYFRVLHPAACERFGKWSAARSRKALACDALLFTLLGLLQLSQGWYLFALFFAGLTVLAALLALRAKSQPPHTLDNA